MYLKTAWVSNVASDIVFRVLVANFGSKTIEICFRRAIAKTFSQCANLVEAHVYHGILLSLIQDENQNSKFRKLQIDVKNIEVINKHMPLTNAKDSWSKIKS